MFWVDNGNKRNLPIIEKANLDGTGRSRVFSVEEVPDRPRSHIAALTIDYSAGRLYWVDQGYLQVNSIMFNGR